MARIRDKRLSAAPAVMLYSIQRRACVDRPCRLHRPGARHELVAASDHVSKKMMDPVLLQVDCFSSLRAGFGGADFHSESRKRNSKTTKAEPLFLSLSTRQSILLQLISNPPCTSVCPRVLWEAPFVTNTRVLLFDRFTLLLLLCRACRKVEQS